jgi:undecaprenyl-diphosphatase
MDTLFIFGAQYVFILSLIIGFFHFIRSDKNTRKHIFLIALIVLPLAFISAKTANYFFINPRPFVVGGFEPLIPHAPDNGFPSDHTLLLSALAAIWTFVDRRTALVLWGITLFVGISRVYAGVHHVLDIVASILISIVCAYLAYAILIRIKIINSKDNNRHNE